MKNVEILEALEVLAAAMPWDTVNIWIERRPEGKISYAAIVQDNPKFGLQFDSAHGDTPIAAVERLIKDNDGKRNPEVAREKKLVELKRQIEQLQEVVIGMPPYVPNRELAERAESLRSRTVDIVTEAA